MHTDQRRLAEASPHQKLWGNALSTCDYSVSSPDTWRGSNLLSQALEHVREILCKDIMPQILDSIPLDTTAPMDHFNDIVFGLTRSPQFASIRHLVRGTPTTYSIGLDQLGAR